MSDLATITAIQPSTSTSEPGESFQSQTVHLEPSDPTVKAILRASFPHYRGRHVTARIQPTACMSGTMWDEGSRDSYVLVSLSTMQAVPMPREQFGERSALHHSEIRLEPGYVLVNHHQYGQRESVAIISHPANVAKLLPPPVELTEDEGTVLLATGLKSSYAGIKDYRFHEARERRGITRERWDTAKAALQSRGLLDARGAITTAGRNARPNGYL